MASILKEAEDAIAVVKAVEEILSDPKFQEEAAAFVTQVKQGFALVESLISHAESMYTSASPELKAIIEKAVPALAQASPPKQ